jgi:hypothetical protein
MHYDANFGLNLFTSLELLGLASYHSTMRRSLLTFLIVLTILRSLVGDAMAYGMTQGGSLTPPQFATNSVASNTDFMPARGHSDVNIKVAMPCHDAEMGNDNPDVAAQSTCTTCQVCHLAASLPCNEMPAVVLRPVALLPQTEPSSWVNAQLLRPSKPPLS